LAALLVPTGLRAQYGRRTQSKGPRALALLEFDTKGDVHLIPVTVMVGKEFYDAGAYKASPVPMALEPETVYEGEQTGVSKGLYTVVKADKVLGTWAGEGIWDDKPPQEAKKFAPPKPPTDDDLDKPPVLRRPGQEAPKPKDAPPAETKAPQNDSPKANAPAKAEAAASTSVPNDDPFAKDEPVLRRGKPRPTLREKILATPTTTAWQVVKTIPAISDAGGPDPRSYAYDMKPDEEQRLRKQVLALATGEVRARAGELEGAMIGGEPPKRGKVRSKPPEPKFDDVQFHAFDVASNNEPVFVLSAKAEMPKSSTSPDLQYFVTMVAREDLYGEMHKVFSNVTDDRHMDLIPRYQLIDAVDADGDGYGELLFRTVWDGGKAFSVYRVIGNQLWPLFEGKP
jgi:hypothetical protein